MSIYQYWGKTKLNKVTNEYNYHLLPYHSLDVTAVADYWLKNDEYLLASILRCSSSRNVKPFELKQLLLFLISIHDIGKFDIRFQFKNYDVAFKLSFKLFSEDKADISTSKGFDHGSAGLYFFRTEDFGNIINKSKEFLTEEKKWLYYIFNHHSLNLNFDTTEYKKIVADDDIVKHNKNARYQFINSVYNLFLNKYSININEIKYGLKTNFLEGFCCVCDWIGSNINYFPFVSKEKTFDIYYEEALNKAKKAIEDIGLIPKISKNTGMANVFPEYKPRGIQKIINKIPSIDPGLTIIEGATGSGKTEAAIVYAFELLSKKLGSGIIFALPTQATANSMFNRLKKIANKLFKGNINVVIIHSKSLYNPNFIELVGKNKKIKCSKWLYNTKRASFLGQIVICTLDQILLSILPVKFNFLRSFGVQKNILIIDEVHAYNSYMNSLLDYVLKKQSKAGGSAILLSATLPFNRKKEILKSWNSKIKEDLKEDIEEYPLITNLSNNSNIENKYTIFSNYKKNVEISIVECKKTDLLPSNEFLKKIIKFASKGARIAFICNLVNDCQKLYEDFKNISYNLSTIDIDIDIFHSRYRFCDRQVIEEKIKKKYHKNRSNKGSILISTQVIEQSLDLDFDLVVTQLAPIDLIFQRIGRDHRFSFLERPFGFEKPKCIVLVPAIDALDYGKHSKFIYKNIRVMWRTHQILKNCSSFNFPEDYRKYIELVYGEKETWLEPKIITKKYEKFEEDFFAYRASAKELIENNHNFTPVKETNIENITSLTRGEDMGIKIILLDENSVSNKNNLTDKNIKFIDGSLLNYDNSFDEIDNINNQEINVPINWLKYLVDNNENVELKKIEKKDYFPIALFLNNYSSYDWKGKGFKESIFTYNKIKGLIHYRL